MHQSKLIRVWTLVAVAAVAGACSEDGAITAPDVSPSFEMVGEDGEVIIGGPGCPGRMTGGGQSLSVDGVSVSKGLTLHCDIELSNNLNVNWDGGHWKLAREQLLSAICIDDPAYNPVPPAAPFDTFIGRGIGRLGNENGSIADFVLIDDGEPGTTDEAWITIYAPNLGPGQVPPGDEVIVLQVGGQIESGNLQAHYDQPHGNGNGNG